MGWGPALFLVFFTRVIYKSVGLDDLEQSCWVDCAAVDCPQLWAQGVFRQVETLTKYQHNSLYVANASDLVDRLVDRVSERYKAEQ